MFNFKMSRATLEHTLRSAFEELGEVLAGRLNESDRKIKDLQEDVRTLRRELETERRLRLGNRSKK